MESFERVQFLMETKFTCTGTRPDNGTIMNDSYLYLNSVLEVKVAKVPFFGT